MLERIESSLFDWQAWRAGSPLDVFGVSCSGGDVRRRIRDLCKRAVGYCEAERVLCRPKSGEVAVMFAVDGREFWFHLREKEFRDLALCSTEQAAAAQAAREGDKGAMLGVSDWMAEEVIIIGGE